MAQQNFKSLFESLGMTAKWLAAELDVEEATVVHWAEGTVPASKAALRKLRTLDSQYARYVDKVLMQAEHFPKEERMLLLTYASDEDLREFRPEFGDFPVSAFQALIERSKENLEAMGYRVALVLMDKSLYYEWLGDRSDSVELRAGWAGEHAALQGKKAGQKASEKTADHPLYPGRKTWSLRLKKPQSVIDREVLTADEFNLLVLEYGLTPECIAYIEGVSLETVYRWASGEAPAFQDVEFGMSTMSTLLDTVAEARLDAVCSPAERAEGKMAGKLALLGIYPTDEDISFFEPNTLGIPAVSHANAISRAADVLSAAGCVTRKVFLSSKEYLQWLNGRKDSDVLRTEWLGLKLTASDEDAFEDEESENGPVLDMTAEEFRALRTAVGLSVGQLAELYDVEPHTVHGWESGESDVPEHVAHDILLCNGKINEIVDDFRTMIVQQKAKGSTRNIFTMPSFRTAEDLWEYFPGFRPFPVDMHNAMLKRLEGVLQENNMLLAVYQFDFSTYRKWLGKRKDNEATRHQWDELQVMQPAADSVN